MPDATANPLVIALVNGEPQAYADLYDLLGQPMFRVAQRMLGATSEAEDAVQDVFVELVRHRQKLAEIRDLNAYVFTTLRHSVGRRIQRQQNERHHLRQLPITDVQQPIASANDELAIALQLLPPDQREVITLKIDGSLTFSQIAVVLNISPNTAASRYRYAIEKLRHFLKAT